MLISDNRPNPEWLQTAKKALLECVGDRVTRGKRFDESKDEHPTPPQISPQDLKENGKLYSDAQIKDLTALCSDITPADIKKAAIKTIIMMGQKATEDEISEDEINKVSKFIKIHACWNPFSKGRITKDALRALGLDVQFSAVVVGLGQDQRKFFLYKGEGADVRGNQRHRQRPEKEKGKHLGKGCYGKVKLLQEEDGQWAVIKVITQSRNPQAAQEQRENLLREVETLRKTAQLVDYYTRTNKKGEIKYEIIMPYFPGKPLHEISYEGSTTAHDAYRIIQGSLHALNKLHHQGILHLDIKSENLIFDPEARNIQDCVRPVDFGFSRSTNNPDGIIQGSPGQMSPELFRALLRNEKSFRYSEADDIHALGITWADAFGMLLDSPLYENNFSNIILSAFKIFHRSEHANIMPYLISGKCSPVFKNAIPDPLTRENFLKLLQEMTDKDLQKRPSTEKCIARLQDFSKFPGFAKYNAIALPQGSRMGMFQQKAREEQQKKQPPMEIQKITAPRY